MLRGFLPRLQPSACQSLVSAPANLRLWQDPRTLAHRCISRSGVCHFVRSLASRSKLEYITVAVCVFAMPCNALQRRVTARPKGRASLLNLVYQVFKNIKPVPNQFWIFLIKTGTEKVEPCFCPTYMHSLHITSTSYHHVTSRDIRFRIRFSLGVG